MLLLLAQGGGRGGGHHSSLVLWPLGHLFEALTPTLVLLVAPPRLLLLQPVKAALPGVLQLGVC